MIDPQEIFDRLLSWAQFSAHYWSLEWPLSSFLTAILAIFAGLVLAFWGSLLLRTLYVVGFMAIGAWVGIHLARQWEVDVLIGFVLGAGVLGLLGHLLFRWWVALSAAVVSILVVAVVGGPWLADRAEDFADSLWEQATGQRFFAEQAEAVPEEWIDEHAVTPTPGEDEPARERPSPMGFVRALAGMIWNEHQPEAARLAVVAGMAAVLALVAGLLLPRFTTIVVTSLVGVLVFATGTASMFVQVAPAAWDGIRVRPGWLAVGLGVILVMSLVFQLRGGRVREVVAAPQPANGG